MKVVHEWTRILREMILDASRIARSYEDIKPSIVNCTLLIVHCFGRSGEAVGLSTLSLLPAPRSLLKTTVTSTSSVPCSPFPVPRSKRMPLQSLTHGGCHKTNASLGLGTEKVPTN